MKMSFKLFADSSLLSGLKMEKERLENMYRACRELRGHYLLQELKTCGENDVRIKRELDNLLQFRGHRMPTIES